MGYWPDSVAANPCVRRFSFLKQQLALVNYLLVNLLFWTRGVHGTKNLFGSHLSSRASFPGAVELRDLAWNFSTPLIHQVTRSK